MEVRRLSCPRRTKNWLNPLTRSRHSSEATDVSSEQSLFLHGERTVIPDQLVVHSPKATNNDIKLLFGTTLYDLKVAEMPATGALLVRDGLRLFSPAAALVRVPESFFQLYPIETQVVMASLADASDLLRLLLNGGHSAKAGYLAKAFRQTGRRDFRQAMKRIFATSTKSIGPMPTTRCP